ncbi:ribonuclease P protein component [Sediminitomix flava]|nr:ribonuclease P protein component [Sediminitomix flava]
MKIKTRQQNFPRKEKLKSRKVIQEMFTEGSSVFSYPFKLYYLPSSQSSETTSFVYPEFLVSVSKRNFKHAVDRNRIKRMIRENYRLHKAILEESGTSLHAIGVVYVGKKIEPFDLMDRKLRKLLYTLGEKA